MKKTHWIILFLFLPVALAGQRKADYGIGVGVTSYIGDINPSRLMYAPLPAGQFFYRYNFNPRQAIRANLLVGGVQATDYDFDNAYQLGRRAYFSGIVGELGVNYEFNFFPYSTEGKRFDYTPYLAAGAALAYNNVNYFNPYVLSVETAGTGFFPVIPFSFGFRINPFKNVGLEAEYGFRKTFYDIFDGLNDNIDPDHYGKIHNNDWYSFAGISITWKILSKLEVCPVYDDNVSKKKRK
jgi:hypothetical protein